MRRVLCVWKYSNASLCCVYQYVTKLFCAKRKKKFGLVHLSLKPANPCLIAEAAGPETA